MSAFSVEALNQQQELAEKIGCSWFVYKGICLDTVAEAVHCPRARGGVERWPASEKKRGRCT